MALTDGGTLSLWREGRCSVVSTVAPASKLGQLWLAATAVLMQSSNQLLSVCCYKTLGVVTG